MAERQQVAVPVDRLIYLAIIRFKFPFCSGLLNWPNGQSWAIPPPTTTTRAPTLTHGQRASPMGGGGGVSNETEHFKSPIAHEPNPQRLSGAAAGDSGGAPVLWTQVSA